MRYWVYMNGEVPGSFTPGELAALPGFSMTALVCPAQGEIAEKNWRRAGEFTDIAKAVAERAAEAPPALPDRTVLVEDARTASADVDAMIDSASTKLFSHVADLMKELESRREEKALIVSLQRQIGALKEELAQTRERADMLEVRLPRIAELEESQRKDRAALETLQASMATREQGIGEARSSLEKMKNELEATKRRLAETANDLAMRNKLIDRMSKDLSEKELSLAKSLGVIRRFEEDLNRLVPDPALRAAAAGASPRPTPKPTTPAQVESKPATAASLAESFSEPPAVKGPALPLAPAPEPLESGEKRTSPPNLPGAYTLDEPPPTPPYLEPQPSDSPKAQQALSNFLKKIFPGQQH